MFDRRERNAKIFKDTEYFYKTNETLKTVVENSVRKQQLILESEKVTVALENTHAGKVIVSGNDLIVSAVGKGELFVSGKITKVEIGV